MHWIKPVQRKYLFAVSDSCYLMYIYFFKVLGFYNSYKIHLIIVNAMYTRYIL